ncbi:hypothetical protein ACN28S_19740 [Cystobacter fuscus]
MVWWKAGRTVKVKTAPVSFHTPSLLAAVTRKRYEPGPTLV